MKWEHDRTAYDVLAVSRSSSTESITAQYKQLIVNVHPDRDASREALIENLQRAIEKPSSEEIYDFSLKVAYGSDWHMPSMVNHPREYLEVFLDIFKHKNPKLKINQEDFFWKNAYKYLNLT